MDVLLSLHAEEIQDDIQIPELLSVANPSNFSASCIINRNTTAAAGKVMYLYADVTSKVDIALEQVVLNNCATCPQQQIHQWQISAERIREPTSPATVK